MIRKVGSFLLSWLDKFEFENEGFFPFTPLWLIVRNLPKGGSYSLLDIGCGSGFPMRFINRTKRFFAVGIDAFLPALKGCSEGLYQELVLADARAVPFKNESFDIVLSIRLLEHLEFEDGQKLIAEMERIARRLVILCFPVGRFPSGGRFEADIKRNPCQLHRSAWRPADLRSLGFKVVGNGVWGINTGLQLAIKMPLFKPLFWLLWILASPISYLVPEIGGSQVAIKRLG